MEKFIIPENIKKVLDILEENGYEAFVVGGCVRDMCRGVVPHDYDVTTSAVPEETKACFSDFRVIETGIKHGTVTVMSDGDPVEITTYRTDGEYVDNRHPKEVTFTPKLELDLSRRDFTVNAMAYSPKRGLVDIFDGISDLQNRVIRCVGDPDVRFGEDGLRILRALRFASTLDFEIEKETSESVKRNVGLLKNISAERIFSELTKLILGVGAERILHGYENVIRFVLPNVPCGDGYEKAVSATAKCTPDAHLRYAMLLLTPAGAEDVKRLKPDAETIRSVKNLTLLFEENVTEKIKVRRLRRKYSGELLKKAAEGKYHAGKITKAEWEWELSLIDETENDPVTPKQLAVTGEDIMALGIPRGQRVGGMLEHLLELVITGRVKNEREELLSEAKKKQNF